jgi:MoaA/NifB/PqqE/SkfB family radical SAM enzyme
VFTAPSGIDAMTYNTDHYRPTAVRELPVVLTPFVEGLRTEAAGRLEALLRTHLADDIRPEVPCDTQRKSADVTVYVHSGGTSLALFLSAKTSEDTWTLGRTRIKVGRVWQGTPIRSTPANNQILRALAAVCEKPLADAADRELARAVRDMRLALEMEDRHYRHIEYAHNGASGRIRVGFGCNQDCHFCWQGRSWPAPPDDLVFTWLEELAASGAKRLMVEGGEPLIWRRLPELIERASRTHGMDVHVNTNAIQLRKPGVAEEYKAAGLKTLMVSLHGADAELSDIMTRAPGTHRHTVEGIHAALDAGLLVFLNCLIEKQNLHDVPNYARFVRDEFVLKHPDNPVLMVNFSQAAPYYEEALFSGAIVAYDEVRPILLEAARTLHEVGVLLEITGTCGFPPCVLNALPEVLPWRPLDTMDPHSAEAREHPASCDKCAVRQHCIGPRREYLSVHGDRGLVPFDYLPTSDWYERMEQSPARELWLSE